MREKEKKTKESQLVRNKIKVNATKSKLLLLLRINYFIHNTVMRCGVQASSSQYGGTYPQNKTCHCLGLSTVNVVPSRHFFVEEFKKSNVRTDVRRTKSVRAAARYLT